MLRKPCTVNPYCRCVYPVRVKAPQSDGEIADVLGGEEAAMSVGEQELAIAWGNGGQGDVVKRNDKGLRAMVLVL